MTHDSGFAPNPFWGRLTLATCKPQIRRRKPKDTWIAGFTSDALCRHAVGQERLVYLMQVDRRIPFAQYFADRDYTRKIPKLHSSRRIEQVGDNIYRPLREPALAPSDFLQLPNDQHYDKVRDQPDPKSHHRDLSGQYVLAATRFVYFGRAALEVPEHCRPAVPRGQSAHGVRTWDEARARRFIDYVFRCARGRRIIAPPTRWPNDDESWREV
jgi:hypothetical protein